VEFLLPLLPAAGCAALMFVCFRTMRHSDMPSGQPETSDELAALREKVATLRAELARTRSAPAAMSER
jgi:hypothetical protein